jgi:hypothetical protein
MLLIVSILFLNFFNLPVIADEDDLPDLVIHDIVYDNELIENEKTKFIVEIKNTGSKNLTGEEIKVALFLDKLTDPITYNSTTDDLNVDKSIYLNISWMPDFGDNKEHTLSIILNHEELFDEESFDNNFHDFRVTINEKKTDLKITNVEIPIDINVNKTCTISGNINNYGKKTNENIIVKMNTSIDEDVLSFKKEGLKRDESFNFKFDWIPAKVGIQKIKINVFLEGDLHDFFEKTIVVSSKNFIWWNENWHYRYFLSVTGQGNFLKSINFSEILEDIGLSSYTFENEKIRIIKYSNDGEVTNESIDYSFIESTNFNNVTNAVGDLKWRVSGDSEIKHYLIYFDVEENIGSRFGDETIVGDISDDVSIYNEGFYESWWLKIFSPSANIPILKGDEIDFNITSVSKIVDVSCYVYNLENNSYNFTLNLDTINEKNWYKNNINLSEEVNWNEDSGNWSVNFSCLDGAGFYYNISDVFYIGQPDLEIKDIKVFIKDDKDLTIFHKNDTLNITASVKSSFLSLKNVSVLFKIENENFVLNETKSYNFTKDEITKIYFNWVASISGKFDLTIYIDYDESFEEKNEENNNMTKKITINDWPDLYVKDISLPSDNISEFDEVKINFVIVNQGLGDAYNYKIGLFIEKISGKNPTMKYENMIDSKIISINKNSSKTFSLNWNSAEPGNWFVGIKIFYNKSNYDTNRWNNKLLSLGTLSVNAIESDKPIINDITISPSVPRQGDNVIILAEIYDASGLKNVKINITDPLNDLHQGFMTRTIDDKFKYEFDSTFSTGEYIFVMTAVDNSVKNIFQTKRGNFTIKKDITEPQIIYFGAEPIVQLLNNTIEISCIVTDKIGISEIELNIFSPDNFIYQNSMELDKNGKYVYKNIYKDVGMYSFNIEIKDNSGNSVKTSKKYFWITKNFNDSDNDGMPNSWEEKYSLDSFNASDSKIDLDNDGYTNLEEYKMKTNPRKNILLQNIAYEIRNNVWYLIISVILFLSLLLVTYHAKRKVII